MLLMRRHSARNVSAVFASEVIFGIALRTFPRITSPQGPPPWLLSAVTCLSAAWLLHIAVERLLLRLRDRATRKKPKAELETEMLKDPAL